MKKSQHYVWRFYLKPWATKNKIWCIRNKRVFNPALENIGQENYFYEAIPLNKDEFDLLNFYIRGMHPTAWKTVQDMLGMYIISSEVSEVSKKEGVEEYHSLIETRAIKSLKCLQNNDLAFWGIEESKLNFCTYIGFQYSRTNKIRQNLMKAFDIPDFKIHLPETIRPNIIARAMPLMIADSIGNWVYSEANITILENRTERAFITGDQPIINMKSDNFQSNIPPKEFELYYPISPNIAIILNNKNSERKILNDESEVNLLNNMIFDFSESQAYASKKSSFNDFL